jgi:UDP-N-acetylmuramyl tripeptide synthase
VTGTKLITPKILIYRRIYRKVHEPGGSLKIKEKSSKSLIIKHYQGFLFSGR